MIAMLDIMQILVICFMAVGIALISRAILKMKQLEQRIDHIDQHMDEMLKKAAKKNRFEHAVGGLR
jgi:predicted Holliday junction resolvase-like endonuclease